ncbi:Cyclin, N-terminal domain containing protein [Trichomonas vaginalis G3]|uniref:Cyclin, N-terminal domain containing protein n=1 Tax=Trichomonas vaginalis (strain ATCC PRA-98 / G3) TaxID=412133 RepID=A2DCS0_TRIV3|nr:cell division [Trichomonas vaginalis G3]EAY21694.1 Cyclin, N-terminal domain containing protein [Trichomonas vaginalis G3]KAI5524326.1 cell division [Trichomonas vaginalis G3]|eukprot:XP_001582680.1 Cyclin, N-terminal domain containing protein [Trichomonas vaginalis G3]
MDLTILDNIHPVILSPLDPKSPFSTKYETSDEYSYEYSFNFDDDYKSLPSKTPLEYVPNTISSINKHQQLIRCQFIGSSDEIRNDFRIIVIDWCIRVYFEMKLNMETLTLGIYIFNSILRRKGIKRCHLQLFAATSLWIASKIEETSTPTLSDYITVCSDSYSAKEFYACEKYILRAMNYDVAFATHEFYVQLALGTFFASEKYQKAVEIVSLVSLFLDDLTDPQNIASAILNVSSSITHESESIWKLSFHINEPAVNDLIRQLSVIFKAQLTYKNGIIRQKVKAYNEKMSSNNIA